MSGHPQFLDPRLPDRFWDKCTPEPNSGCWLWTAALKPNGYGQHNFYVAKTESASWRKTSPLAHRFAYLALRGPVPVGLHLDHLCRQRSCVNPAHLEAVTCKENARRGLLAEASRARGAARTHCKRGHEFTAQNTYQKAIGRECRTCRKAALKSFWDRKGGRV